MPATSRSSSLPSQGNPFWSAAVQGEWRLRTSRPVDLPVPDWLAEEEWGDYRRFEGQGSDEAAGAMRDRFTTPSSWETVNAEQTQQIRTEGQVPGPGVEDRQARFQGLRTQGPDPSELWRGQGHGDLPGMRSQGTLPPSAGDVRKEIRGKDVPRGAPDDVALEREVEALLMEKMAEENRLLKDQIMKLQQRQVETDRSRDRERTPPPRPPPPPLPATPRASTGRVQHGEPRYTPQGTQVPLSPMRNLETGMEYPEVPEFPQWTCIGGGAAMESKSREPAGGGREGLYGYGGSFSGDGAPMPSTATEARTRWLEKEVRSLQATLEKMAGEARPSGYWEQPIYRAPELEHRGVESVGEAKEESLRSVPITIPSLVPPDAKNAALEAGDWLAQLRPLVGDVAASATKWWDDLMLATNQAYHTWLSLGPLERLHIQAPTMEETSFKQTRLDQRVTMMLMNALPTEIKNELIATRQLHSAGVIFKVLRTYQPGGLGEKAATLAALTETRPAETAIEGASALRLWRRQALRAAELGVTLPDPTLQVRALDVVMSKLLQGDPQATFRVQSFRLRHEVDVQPNQWNVDKLFELLQAECDQMLHSRAASLGTVEDKPLVKAFTTGGKGADGAATCKWWGSDTGCRAGKACPFAHAALEDRSARCWLCSSKHHLKPDCPTRSPPSGQQTGSAGGSDGADGKGKGKSKAKPKGKDHNRDFKKGKSMDRRDEHDGKGLGGQPSMTGSEDRKEEGKGMPNIHKTEIDQSSQEPAAGSQDTTSLVNEVTSLLRSLRVGQEPAAQLKACHLMKFEVGDGAMTLIDGGATHCLRQADSSHEWASAKPVKVMVASGEVELRQNVETGTILADHPVQKIVPVSRLVDEGYTVRWDRNTCRLEHPAHGKVEVTMCQGCPMVSDPVGRQLMDEIEASERRKARIRSVLDCGIIAETDYEKQIAELVSLFPEVPLRLLENIPGEKDWNPELIQVNRRMRRRLQKADRIVIDMFSGPDKGRWSCLERRGLVVLNMDILHGHNVHDPQVAGFVQSVLETGKVVGWVSGPPCRTVSACRLKGDGGPPRLRAREGAERFGLHELKTGQQEKTDGDSILWLKNLYWMTLAQRWNSAVKLMVEQPRDPAEWMGEPVDGRPPPSFLCWPETDHVAALLGLKQTKLDQGALGHCTRKPTTILSNINRIWELHGLRSSKPGESWPEELERRLEWSGQLAAWAPGLVRVLAEELVDGEVAGRSRWATPQVKALTTKEKKELQGWKAHYEQDRIPFRRDCITCLETMGKDRMRKRVSCPQAFCLSLDVAGPFKAGKDQILREPRYFMVGVVTIPVRDQVPLVDSLRELGVVVQPVQDHPDEMGDGGAVAEGEGPVFEQEGEESREPVGQEDAVEIQALDQKWKDFLQENRDAGEVQMRSLTFGVPLVSRHAAEIIKGAALIYSQVRALNIPLLRIHTDRAREFASAEFRRWAYQRDLFFTMSAGDEPCGNSRVEREIGLLKGHVRALLQSAKAPLEYWPLALRHVVAQRSRTQLRAMGIQTPEMLPFGGALVAKRKTWFNRGDPWKPPMERVTCWGPAADMSMTSRGYYVRNGEGKWFRSTVLVQPADIPDTLLEVQNVIEEKFANDDGDSVPAGPEPRRQRLVGKQPPRGVHPALEISERPPGEPGMQPHDPPRTRCVGKQPVGQSQSSEERRRALEGHPSLRALREGGEELHPHPSDGLEPAERHGNDKRWVMLQLMQHRQLSEIIRDETARMLEHGSSTSWAVICQAKDELEELELQLREEERRQELENGGTAERGAKHGEDQPRCFQAVTRTTGNGEEDGEPEVLQTRTVSMEEVKRELSVWVEPFRKEVEHLTGGPVSRMTAQEFQALKNSGAEMQVIPMKMVATRKPTKLKGRIVACGNLAQEYAHDDISAGGACAVAVRTAIHVAANKGWNLGSIDVTGAFLQAPRRGNGKLTICEPPRLLQAMGLTQPGEVWKVGCALYGFAESPSDWGRYRDDCLEKVTWKDEDQVYSLVETPERHVWMIKQADGATCGNLCVYVDDILAGAKQPVLQGLFKTLKETWVCSDEEYVSRTKAMRFCGYDILAREDGGYEVSQGNYLRDLLARREVRGTEGSPAPRIEEGEDEQWDANALKQAQSITGEVQWLSNRTRPDIAYATGLMSRMLHRRPRYVVKLGEHLLRYLNGAVDFKLTYKPFEVWEKEGGGPEIERSLGTLEVFSDASFAPPHEQFRSVQGLLVEHGRNLILWSSSRQAFIVQSTAEAELLSYTESYQAGESVGALLEIFGFQTRKHLLGDNKAALVLCTGETGPWRTRHLRLRAAKLREAVRGSTWSAGHLRGDQLVADGLTKSLLGQSFEKFLVQLGMKELSLTKKEVRDVKVEKVDGGDSESRSSMVPGILAAASLAVVSSGQVITGGLIALCAALVWRGQKHKKEHQESKEARRLGGKAHNKAQEGKPSHGGASIDQKAETSFRGSSSPSPSSPALRAFRVGVGSHGVLDEPAPEPPTDGSGFPEDHGGSRPRPTARPQSLGTVAVGSRAQAGRRGEAVFRSGWRPDGRAPEAMSTAAGSMTHRSEPLGELLVHLAGGHSTTGGHHGGHPIIDDHHGELPSELPPAGVSTGIGGLRGDGGSADEDAAAELADEDDGRWSSVSGLDEDPGWMQGPWNEVRFGDPGRGRDQWILDCWGDGWLIRVHPRARLERFVPRENFLPCSPDLLEGERVTKQILRDGSQKISFDSWRERFQEAESWRGFTFLKLRDAVDLFQGATVRGATVTD